MRKVAGIVLMPLMLVGLLLLAIGGGLAGVYAMASLTKTQRDKAQREVAIKSFVREALKESSNG